MRLYHSKSQENESNGAINRWNFEMKKDWIFSFNQMITISKNQLEKLFTIVEFSKLLQNLIVQASSQNAKFSGIFSIFSSKMWLVSTHHFSFPLQLNLFNIFEFLESWKYKTIQSSLQMQKCTKQSFCSFFSKVHQSHWKCKWDRNIWFSHKFNFSYLENLNRLNTASNRKMFQTTWLLHNCDLSISFFNPKYVNWTVSRYKFLPQSKGNPSNQFPSSQ